MSVSRQRGDAGATAATAHVDYVRSLGANHVIDYQTERFEDIARDIELVLDYVGADLTDVSSLRAALSSVRTIFLLNAVTPDVTQALITLNLAREAGIERIVYLSVIHADKYT